MSERGRITLFIPHLGIGGAEIVFVTLANAFARRGLKVDLLLWTATGPFLTSVDERVRIEALNTRNPLKLVIETARYLRREKPAVVLSALFPANIIAGFAKALSRSPATLIVTEHVHLDTYLHQATPLWRMMVRLLIRASYRHADHIVAVAQGAAESLAPIAGVDRNAVHVIHNPIDLDRIDTLAQDESAAPVGSDLPIVISVGRLISQKNHELLLRAFAAVRSRRPCWLVILGDGEKRAELTALARSLGVESDVSMPGFVDNPYAWMRKSAVFVLSSRYEGLPTVLIEAMQCGLPIVSADCPSGPAEILENGRWGRLFEPGDVDGLVVAILAGLNGELPTDGRRRAADFSLDKAVSSYLALIEPALAPGGVQT